MSNSSLYGDVGNVTVLSNNLTTLYNATGGNIVTANVPDRDFTTLYTNQATINPTYAYGNSNVEAFLNVGFDAGGNIVQNINADGSIHANGNLTINGISNLGPASNVHITGGNLNYVLQTDGSGNLSWTPLQANTANGATYIHFAVASTGNGQTFTNSNLSVYANSNTMAVFKNGVNIEPDLYSISGNILTVNILLNTGDTIDILPSVGAGGTLPGGNLGEIQYNGGATLSANSSFKFDQPNSLMTVGKISTGNITGTNTSITTLTVSGTTSLGNIGNVHITGGISGQFISTDGNGNLSWSGVPLSNITANINNVHISGGTSGQVLSTDGNSNLSWTSYIANANYANSANTANSALTANTANSATFATSATTAGSATTAATVTASAQPNITSFGALTSLSVAGTTDTGILKTDYLEYSNGTPWVFPGTYSNSNVANYLPTYTGNISANYYTGNGSLLTGIISTSGNANYANFAGTAFSVAGANVTGIVGNATHANYADVANSVAGANVTGQVSFAAVANSVAGANVTGQVTYAAIANSVAGANVSGAVAYATVANSVAGANVSGTVANATYAITAGTAYSVSGSNVSGAVAFATTANSVAGANVSGQVSFAAVANSVAGANVSGTVSSATTATTAGTVTTAAQPNITSVGTLTSITVAGMTSIQEAKEKFVPNSTGATGTVNFDMLTSAIILQTANASANFTINIRGNSTTTFNSSVSANESVSLTYVNKNGATAYYANTFQIDSVNITPVWTSNAPAAGTTNGYDVYNFNILKTAANTYVVFGVAGGYQ